MGKQHQEFQARLRRLEGKHNDMSAGYSARVRSDGLIVVAPRQIRSRITPRAVVFFLCAFFLFKGFLMAALGFASYDARVADLSKGVAVERVGAFLMQAEPVSMLIGEKLRPYLH
ncbi:hypothetical protein JL2886_03030 [Phaeobacter gallaeciensis]|uniref:Uncharacterized protein n=1 Tax=Phaeobacter gallaeciensis TaxID=60890 RepID=A0A1B0ZUR9_9RHOB|nr:MULTISPECIES: hypothetical protein [Phaeobacter]MDF1773802.1 hypothetical protein [Pseudophaeobacter sp. bin_em_oilr2.035]MEE2635070.1 hypothetical protein [Pseudomonadota bacterium]ANP37916.1 hypothetical protein JL2886_03030 [Phaeobacter gallaeciensis]MDE4060635.1 hypothetical protein [Phaeobacter gallaeciensis]MDE4123561.1 hypothetical protein [Phaeobacter gallaeciensis]